MLREIVEEMVIEGDVADIGSYQNMSLNAIGNDGKHYFMGFNDPDDENSFGVGDDDGNAWDMNFNDTKKFLAKKGIKLDKKSYEWLKRRVLTKYN
jgi:hypothetical protein